VLRAGCGRKSDAAIVFGIEDVYEFIARTVDRAVRIIDVVVG
jgi:hypothetical protein